MVNKNILKITPYQPGKPIEEVKREMGLKEVIKLASNENPLGPSPEAVSAIRKAVSKINRYPEGSCFYLRQALSKKLKLNPGNLIFGNGSDEIIDIIIKTFSQPGDEILTSEVTFLEYKIIALQNGRLVTTAPMKDFRYDLAGLKAGITPKTRIIFIANPNNPTGTYLNKQEVENFISGLPEDILVVFDEAYLEFVEKKDFPRMLDYVRNRKNVIVLRTFSKIYGLAGLRIGYAIANQECIAYLERARQPFNVNMLAQEAARAALSDRDFVNQTKKLVREGKRYLEQALKRLGLEFVPSAANFILIDLKEDGLKVSRELLKRGVIVRDMCQYGLRDFIRVTVGLRKENEKFIKELKRIILARGK